MPCGNSEEGQAHRKKRRPTTFITEGGVVGRGGYYPCFEAEKGGRKKTFRPTKKPRVSVSHFGKSSSGRKRRSQNPHYVLGVEREPDCKKRAPGHTMAEGGTFERRELCGREKAPKKKKGSPSIPPQEGKKGEFKGARSVPSPFDPFRKSAGRATIRKSIVKYCIPYMKEKRGFRRVSLEKHPVRKGGI